MAHFALLHTIEACLRSSLVICGGSISVRLLANHMPLHISDPLLPTRDPAPSHMPTTQIIAVAVHSATCLLARTGDERRNLAHHHALPSPPDHAFYG